MPKYLGDVRGLKIKEIGYYAWIPYAVSAVGCFLGGWFSGVPRADFNHDGFINVQDIFDFLAAWFLGC